MSKTKPVLIDIPIYDQCIECFSASSDIIEYYRKEGIKIKMGKEYLGWAWDKKDKDDNKRFLICIPESYSLKDLLVVVHEIDHIAFMILKYVGVKVKNEGNEAHAHLVGFILDEVLSKFYKLKY